MPTIPCLAAIYYVDDGYVTGRSDLKGRHVAGESFLTGLFRHSGMEAFACHAYNDEAAAGFFELARRLAPGCQLWLVPTATPEGLSQFGALFLPGPSIGSFAWRRRQRGQRRYSLCGITHTTSEAPVFFADLVTAPLQPWDALICTTHAARSSIAAVMEPYAEFLRERSTGGVFPLPEMPVIPLGIDADAFEFDEAARQAERRQLGIGDDEIVVLFLGRLSSHSKANPIPMYIALQRAAERTGRRIHLIQAGWFSHPLTHEAFVDAARRHCPDINAIFLDGRLTEVRTRIWAAADLFTSLSDNIQETFGISPIEAMAASLPGVVSDWNGYRETLRDGIDGFRVPTLFPPPGAGADLSDRYGGWVDDYDHYIGRVAQLTAVDIDAAADAYTRLVADPGLRRTMGAAARARAVATFDWRAIIPHYLDLWRHLAAVREQAAENAPWYHGSANLHFPDPFAMFAAYPTVPFSDDLRLVRCAHASMAAVQAIDSEVLNAELLGTLSPRIDLETALDALAPPVGRTVGELLSLVPAERRMLLARSLIHLAKFGLIRRVTDGVNHLT